MSFCEIKDFFLSSAATHEAFLSEAKGDSTRFPTKICKMQFQNPMKDVNSTIYNHIDDLES